MAISNTLLNPGDKTNTTSRITKKSGESLVYYVNVSVGDIQFAIFKNGEMFLTAREGPGTYTREVTGAEPAEYSLRLYCGTRDNQKTGCEVYPAFIKTE